MESNVKLEKIKKSCRAGEIVTKILFIIAVIGFICSLVAGSVILSLGSRFDAAMAESGDEWNVTFGAGIARATLFGLDLGDPSKLESDIPVIQAAIEDHPYSVLTAAYLLGAAFITSVIAVMMKLIGSIFTLIRQEETPFNDKVIKRVVIVLAVTSGILLFTSGGGSGVLGGIITWVVYTILDYGKTLQQQSDETL